MARRSAWYAFVQRGVAKAIAVCQAGAFKSPMLGVHNAIGRGRHDAAGIVDDAQKRRFGFPPEMKAAFYRRYLAPRDAFVMRSAMTTRLDPPLVFVAINAGLLVAEFNL